MNEGWLERILSVRSTLSSLAHQFQLVCRRAERLTNASSNYLNQQTVGPILSLRRPSPPFAFVEYSEPESVLRCLEIVNGLKLSMASGEEKTLLIKADEKNRARLDEYEKTRITTDVSVVRALMTLEGN